MSTLIPTMNRNDIIMCIDSLSDLSVRLFPSVIYTTVFIDFYLLHFMPGFYVSIQSIPA